MILCLGTTPSLARSYVLNSLTLDAVNRAVEVRDAVAGKANNTARAVKTLGEQSMLLGFAGGNHGRIMLRRLAEEGIATDFVTVAHETRLCVTVIDRLHHAATELVEETPAVTSDDVEKLMARFRQHLPKARALVLSGSLAPGVNKDFYLHCTQAAHERGIPVVLDATGPALTNALLARPMVIKPNRSELAQSVGGAIETDQQLKEAIRAMVREGTQWVIMTQGPAGAVVSDGKEFHRVSIPKVQPVSAIGSGDSFSAGVAVGIVQGMSVPNAARLGAACGSANVLTTAAAFFSMDDVNRLLKEIKLTPL
jgi:tagatose 6-phosphate kinase